MAARLPLLATLLAAARDVFGDLPGTLRSFWFIGLLLIVIVEVPMLFLSDYVGKHVLPELKQQVAEASAQVTTPTGAKPGEIKPSDEIPNLPKSVLARNPSTMWVVLLGLGLNTVQMLLLFRFMVGWYRRLLVGEGKGKTISLRLAKPEWQLMWTSVKVAFAFLPVALAIFVVITFANPTGDPNALPAFNIWPYLVVIGVVALYLQARLALAYPITCMEGTDAPVRQSWNLTRRQAIRIALGNLLTVIPLMLGIGLLFLGLSWILANLFSVPENGEEAVAMAVRLVLKSLSVFSMLFLVAGLSAFHARSISLRGSVSFFLRKGPSALRRA
ncbi:MAG: hypothetical protein HY053_01845 [Proteobacteria bacterium]|nr:hypothetical protein [Pseudomonadota bacterium]